MDRHILTTQKVKMNRLLAISWGGGGVNVHKKSRAGNIISAQHSIDFCGTTDASMSLGSFHSNLISMDV